MAVTNITVGLSWAAAVPAARNLGVMMDHALNMDTHIQRLCRIAMFHLRNIADIRRCLTHDAAEKLIHAFVTSHLDFLQWALGWRAGNVTTETPTCTEHGRRILTGTRKCM